MIREYLVAALCLCVASASAAALEKPVKGPVPKPVMKTVTSSYPKAKVLETVFEEEDGQKVYEVRLQNGDVRLDLKIDAEGKIHLQEHPLDLKSIPATIANAALAPPYADWKVKGAEKVENLDAPARSGYEVMIEKDGKARELLLSPEGKLLNDEAEDDRK